MGTRAQFTAEQIEAVNKALTSSRDLVRHYTSDLKEKQNAALVAAGLTPLHDLSWDKRQRAHHERQVAALESLLAIIQRATVEQTA